MAYVLGVDVGTTQVRCFAIGADGSPLSSHFVPLPVLHPQPIASEIDPFVLWECFLEVVRQTMSKGNLDPKEAACLGITCQRNSFLLWKRATNLPLCNIITWQDRRAATVCKEWNESMQLKFLHAGASLAHLVTRNKRFLAASIITFITQQTAPRLYWALRSIEGANEMAAAGELCFGTIDTWLLWKLTDGKVHATDYSNIATTVLYDPFQMRYSTTVLNMLGIPMSILPEVRDSGGDFGRTEEHLFGASIPITGIISDQTSAMFAQGCWKPGDLKCTMGTGMFLSINTGSKPHASLAGFYPVIGWKIGKEIVFLAEANIPSCGSAIEWGMKFGLYGDPAETEAIAMSVPDADNVCFVPAFDGIQAPFNDPFATASVIGITHNTRREHIVRALLESLAFSVKQIYDVGKSEIDLNIQRVCIDGGVSANDFVVQLVSDLLAHRVQRPKDVDMTVYGAVYIAGLATGFWKSRDEIQRLWQLDRVFEPSGAASQRVCEVMRNYRRWQGAVERSLGWYKSVDKMATDSPCTPGSPALKPDADQVPATAEPDSSE